MAPVNEFDQDGKVVTKGRHSATPGIVATPMKRVGNITWGEKAAWTKPIFR